MRRKPRVGIDLRDVAIYTRKSKLTHMGDSTGIQMKQSADFARSQLNLPEDYCFLEYEDKGLSGYYADRPDFQRMLHDIEAGKIRAVVCYKLDRISRKTSDLLRLIDFFNKHDVALLVCSNNINTLISTSKIMISFLAIIAEFERDIIAERIADNLIELAKDGRWMGGCMPTGFKAIRNTIGSGKNKTSITHLEPIPDEKKMVQQIFKTFRQCRSINKTATTIGEDYKTKFGKEHTSLSIKDILSNPIYCTADEISFDYFYQKNGNICSDEKDFDAIHGIMAYNKTDQERLEDEESTFIEPKFVQVCADNAIHSAAGMQLREECDDIMKQRQLRYGRDYEEPTGTATLTSAYNLPCEYVIHTVGPIVYGSLNDELCRDLRNCYENVLQCCLEHQIKSVAFCCISTGEFHFPNDRAAEIAVETVRAFLEEHDGCMERIIFNVFKDSDKNIYEKILTND